MRLVHPVYVACLFSLYVCHSVSAGFRAGRVRPPERNAAVRIHAGSIINVEGSVEETSRLFYTVVGREADQATREDYDIEDFGMDGGYATLGFSTESIWSYFTLETDLLLLDMDTSSTAIRNYYIGVDSVRFAGNDYEYMQIPEGRPFTAELTGVIADLRGLITPFTLEVNDHFAATPWISVGLFFLAGTYEIDAGTPSGLIQYQNPPETFVVGGTGDGTFGGGLPEIGAGGELRFGAIENVHLLVHANVAICTYSGSTDWITTSDHREKDIDLDHLNIKAGASLEIPLESGRALTVGAQLHMIDTEATITTQGGTVEEIIAARERFDKEVDFEMLIATGSIGWRF